MNRRRLAGALWSAGLALIALGGWRLGRDLLGWGRPNVLLITLDTTRADRLGCYGYAGARTPALDRLAARGVLFEQAVCSAPLTLPSHATILTGLLPPEHGLRLNSVGALPAGVPTLATELRRRGYRTAAFVAATVLAAKFGLDRGFQVYDDNIPPEARRGGGEGGQAYRSGESVADAAIRWLQQPSRAPFFCWVHFYDPHWPYHAHTDRFGAQFADRPYDAEIAYLDAQVQRLLDALTQTGVGPRTLIVAVGDHGETLAGEPHAEPRPHHGLMLYRGTMRVPLILCGAGVRRHGRRVGALVETADVFPTVLACCGARAPARSSGRDLRPWLRGRSAAPRACYGESELPASYGWSGQRSLTTEEWKYIRSPVPELYDLVADPNETNNLAAARRSLMEDLDERLRQIESAMTPRAARTVTLSASERRKIESLGYLGGGQRDGAAGGPRHDIKEMLPLLWRSFEAEALVQSGRVAEALSIWRELTAESPETILWRNSLGVSLLKVEQAEEAVRTLEALKAEMERDASALAAVQPDGGGIYPAVVNNLAFALCAAGKHAEALPLARQAVELEKDNGSYRHTLATALRGSGDRAAALQAAQIAADLLPSPEHLLTLAQCLQEAGQTRPARNAALRVLQMPADAAEKERARALLEKLR